MSSNPYDPTQNAYPPSGPYYGTDGPYPSQQPFTGYPPQPDQGYQQPGYAQQQQQQPYYPPAAPAGMYQPQQPGYIGYVVPQPAPANGPGIASLVLGIVGLFVFWVPFLGLAISVIGLVLASAGMKRLSGKGMAIAGLVLSIIALVLSGCVTVALFTSGLPFYHYY